MSDSGQTILFVDDHEHFLVPISGLLSKSGFRVITATNGNDALQKACQFDGVIDVLVADVQIPGMSGIELAIQLRRMRHETKILLISGYDWRLLAESYGWPFLRKPFHFEELKNGIRKALAEDRTLKATDPTGISDYA
jgi:DNA-binding response OmpR family regulator